MGVFLNFWLTLSGPGHQPNELFLAYVFLELKLNSTSFEPLLGFLAYLLNILRTGVRYIRTSISA